MPVQLSAALAAVAMVLLLARTGFGRVQWFILAVGIGVSVAYAVSAFLARPDWGRAAVSLVIPHGNLLAPVYLLAIVGTVGTILTPWGQAFIQSYVVDKGLKPAQLTRSRLDIALGSTL